MKFNIKHLSVAGLLLAAVGFGSCTDEIKVGNSFLEKAPGGTVTADTVFSNPEYARQFLANAYRWQYYNLPSKSSNNPPQCLNYWKGMVDALGDTHQLFFTNTVVNNQYYSGALTANDGTIHPYNNEHIWESVRQSLMLIERIDEVPEMGQDEKERMKDEARCLLAMTYFNTFRHYGGLPIIRTTFSGNESSYEGRATAAETVDYMVEVLDEVINGNHLPWGYTGAEASSETGRWTLAGAMALKCEILQFAASPLLNSAQPYHEGKYSVEHPEYTWMGGYDDSRWMAFRRACDDFFNALASRGVYHLVQPEGTTQADYRWAYRYAYVRQGNPESIHSVRIATSAHGNDYIWWNLGWGGGVGNDRLSYGPTQEYVEMFPWADGKPFNWEESAALPDKDPKSLQHMFVMGDTVGEDMSLVNRKYTRDPRLYETAAVNGAQITTNWDNGEVTGNAWEAWVGGTNALQMPANITGVWGTGYFTLKYTVGACMDRNKPQWNYLTLSRMYLNYAEAILQSGGAAADAIKYVDAVRARVGLCSIAEAVPAVLSSKEALLQEILRERACEGAFEMTRYWDMIRYKRADLFERKLHGLRIYRMVRDNDSAPWRRAGADEATWWNSADKGQEGINRYEPSYFEFEKYELSSNPRSWWTTGFEPKWYFQPFPVTEVNKGYGLEQNPGW